jgi:hypothetical protein
MPDPKDTPEPQPRPRQTDAAETPRAPDTLKNKGRPAREERLAKALRENLKRRKASAKKD